MTKYRANKHRASMWTGQSNTRASGDGCDLCGRAITVTPAGFRRFHKSHGRECPGSGTPVRKREESR